MTPNSNDSHLARTLRRSLARKFVPAFLASLLLVPLAHADDDVLKQWENQKAQAQTFFRNLPALGDRRLQDLFLLRPENNFLALSSSAAQTPGGTQMRVNVEGIPGAAYVAIHRDRGTGALDRFELDIRDFPAPKRATNLQVRCDPDKGQLILTYTVEADGGIQQTMLSQERGSATGTTGFVQLSFSSSTPDNLGSQQLNFDAADFVSLLRQRPEQTNLYVRPLLRRLDQEPLFAPDPLTAWQVFRESHALDPAAVRRINELLPRLNDPDYRARRSALANLKRLGRGGADAVDRLDRAALSPQQNLMLDAFLAPYKPISDSELTLLRTDPTFLLDCLYSEDTQVRKSALDRLRTMFRPDLDFDIDAPADIRTLAVANLRKQITPMR